MYQMLALILDLVLLMAVYVFTYPKIQRQSGDAGVLCDCLCRRNAFYVYQTRMLDGGKFPCMADFPVLLGLRYVCILCRRTLLKT